VTTRYGIAEWYGHDFRALAEDQRRELAKAALDRLERPCPFRGGPCTKTGGVCSMRPYTADGIHLDEPAGAPVIMCPYRFEQDSTLTRWLAQIVGFDPAEAMLAREVPFMVGATGRPAGKVDLVIAAEHHGLRWYGLEIQAVYFSGPGMDSEFRLIAAAAGPRPPFPSQNRRPDWRSSSAKRLAPQLQIKVPTMRRWGSKLAVAVDRPFFDAVGGPSPDPSHDLDAGDVIWLVSEATPTGLRTDHWEVLTLEQSCEKLLAAIPISRTDFEGQLRDRLQPMHPNGRTP